MSKSNYDRSESTTDDNRFENGVAELEQPTKHAERTASTKRDTLPTKTSAVFRMASSRSKQGFMKLLWAGVSTGLSVFLLAEMPHTPGLALNLGIIGGIGLVAAAVLTLLADRDLTGRLSIDEQGIALEPRWAGFNFGWKQVSSWQTTDEDELPPQMQQLKLWPKGNVSPIIVDTSWLSVESRGTLRKVLREVAAEDHLG